MNSQIYQIYKDMMSPKPIFDFDYLAYIMQLGYEQSVTGVDVTRVERSDTALLLYIEVMVDGGGSTEKRRLFIKTVKGDTSGNAYDTLSIKEAGFYSLLRQNSRFRPPVPVCHDVFVSEEKNEFLIALEDISKTHAKPSEKQLEDKNIWFLCAECLANFHSVFWNYHEKGLYGQPLISNSQIENDINTNSRQMQYFLSHVGGCLDAETRSIFNNALKISNAARRQMLDGKNITLTNGDSHIFNFMLPMAETDEAVLVDFQFWNTGKGVADLAHLTRISFPYRFKRILHRPLVEHYHKALVERGVTNYSLEECYRDYRMQVAGMLLLPVWQYFIFGKEQDWNNIVKGLADNYSILDCDDLL